MTIILALLLGCGGEDPPKLQAPVDADGDGHIGEDDCDDADPAVHPGAEETCDEVDNDCNGVVDDAEIGENHAYRHLYWADDDGDRYGTGEPFPLCYDQAVALDSGTEYSRRSEEDCDDHDILIHPLVTECIGNGKDDDCDGEVDEADGSTGALGCAEAYIRPNTTGYGFTGIGQQIGGGRDLDGDGDAEVWTDNFYGAYLVDTAIFERGMLERTDPRIEYGSLMDLGISEIHDGGDLDGDGYEDLLMTSWLAADRAAAAIVPGPLDGSTGVGDGPYLPREGDGSLGAGGLVAELDEAAGTDLAVVWTDWTDAPDYLALFSGPFQESTLDLDQATILTTGEVLQTGYNLPEKVDLAGDGIGYLAVGWGDDTDSGMGIALVELPTVSSSLEDHDQIVAGESTGPCFDIASGGDLDGDGREELLVVSNPGTFSVYFVSGTIEGQVTMDDLDGPRIDVDEGWPYNCERSKDAGKDLNGDGHPDLVVQNFEQDTDRAEVYLGPFEGVREGPGDFTMVWTSDWTYGPDVGSELILSDDLTGDGSNDLVVGGPNDLDADASFIFVFNGATMFPDG